MLLLDQWALHRAHELQAQISAAYERYDFAEVVQRLNNFCTVDMGSIYLDVTKDRLYTMQQQALGRRSAQTAMRSEEHTSELQSLMRISYAAFCLKKKNICNLLIQPYIV